VKRRPAPPETWERLEREIVACERCPRLVAHRRRIARERRRAYREQEYWGRPVPGFGDRRGRLLILGLAPAAHGANRTGRMFTGDGSGEWLFRALHRAGLSNRAESTAPEDGLRLRGAFISAACRCAPPQNRPTVDELHSCSAFLDREIELLGELRVVLALGGIAWRAALRRAARVAPASLPRPLPKFGHGVRTRLTLSRSLPGPWLLGSYHPSRQNTQTGRLTRPMLLGVIRRAVKMAGLDASGP
jgi:uracil-DNA glycosylase family 4